MPTPQQDEVLIRVAVTGVNFIDLYVREGGYGKKVPFTPGQEAAGTVVEVGKGVSHLQEGDRVAWCSILGTYQAGADDVILYTRSDFGDEVKRLPQGRGLGPVCDSSGKDTVSSPSPCLKADPGEMQARRCYQSPPF